MASPHGESSAPRETRRTRPPGKPGRAVEVEDIDKAVMRAGHVVVLSGVLQGVGDVDLPVEDLDVERGVPVRQPSVLESARR